MELLFKVKLIKKNKKESRKIINKIHQQKIICGLKASNPQQKQ